MALNATIFKVVLQVSDLNRHYYAEHALTLARHPSETDERLMARLLAFALHAGPDLAFGRGLCADDEADVWQHGLTGDIELWIDVGQPDEKWVRKASQRAERTVVLGYGRHAARWWDQNRGTLERLRGLTVLQIGAEDSRRLASWARNGLRLQCTIQDELMYCDDGAESMALRIERLWPSQ